MSPKAKYELSLLEICMSFSGVVFLYVGISMIVDGIIAGAVLITLAIIFIAAPICEYLAWREKNEHTNKKVANASPVKPKKLRCDYCGTETELGCNCINCGAVKAEA